MCMPIHGNLARVIPTQQLYSCAIQYGMQSSISAVYRTAISTVKWDRSQTDQKMHVQKNSLTKPVVLHYLS